MSSKNQNKTEHVSGDYIWWTPGEGRCVSVGPEGQKVALPPIPLPLHREDLQGGDPSDDAIGKGLYDYLRQFPDCVNNLQFAELLRDGYPHYLADIGAQIVMLDHKEVDAPYFRRKLVCMKILALLEPDNAGLLQQMGRTCYDLGLMFAELGQSRRHLLEAMGYFQRSLKSRGSHPSALNYLAQIDYLFGDFPGAARRWQGVIDQVEDVATCQALRTRIEEMEGAAMPDHPLIDDLEAIGDAMAAYGRGEVAEATLILERLEEEGAVMAACPAPEFFYLLGMCRGKQGDAAGAFAALEQALELDPDYAPAQEARDRILDQGRI